MQNFIKKGEKMRNLTEEKTEMLTRVFKNLEKAMSDRNMNRNKIKELTGVNLARYKVSEDMREPSLTSIIKIADALQISLDELCGRTQFVRDLEHWNAGECLDMLLRIAEQLNGTISEQGMSVQFPYTNVAKTIENANEYTQWYTKGQQMEPERFSEDPEAVKMRYLQKEIEKMKAENEGILLLSCEAENVPDTDTEDLPF